MYNYSETKRAIRRKTLFPGKINFAIPSIKKKRTCEKKFKNCVLRVTYLGPLINGFGGPIYGSLKIW